MATNPAPPLLTHAGVHGFILLAALILWSAADSWLLLTGLGLATVLAVLSGLLAGLVTNTVIHEWSHFIAVVLSGARYQIPARPGFFVYEFDFENNSVRQFNIMSWGGQLGSIAAVTGLYLLIPMDNPGRAMLLAATLGGAIFGAVIEAPVLLRTQTSQDPLAELSKIRPATLKRAATIGGAAGLLCWLALV